MALPWPLCLKGGGGGGQLKANEISKAKQLSSFTRLRRGQKRKTNQPSHFY